MSKNRDSSDLTNKLRVRTIYADLIAKQQKLEQGCVGYIVRQTGGVDNTLLITRQEGAQLTTPTEQTTILANNQCPVLNVPIVIILKLLILGDSTVTNVATALTTRFSELGYTNTISITSRQLSTTETGSDLTTTNYDVLLMYTGASDTGATALNSAIASFIDSGGHFINGGQFWRYYPGNFTTFSTRSALNVATGVSFNRNNDMTVIVAGPITNGVGVALTNGQNEIQNGNGALISGGTLLAKMAVVDTNLVATATKGSANLVSINLYLGNLNIYTNLRNLVANAVLYTKSLI